MDPKLLAAVQALQANRKSDAADLLISYLSAAGDQAQPNSYGVLLGLLTEFRRIDDGLVWSERAIAALRRDANMFNFRGTFLRLAGRLAEAIEAYEQASRLKPGDIAAKVNKAHCYIDLGKGKAAEQLLTPLVRQYPRDASLHRTLARSLSLQHKFEAAETRLRHLLSFSAGDVDAWLDLSAAAADRGDHPAALAVIDRALQALPDEQRLLRARAVMLRLSSPRQDVQSFLTALLPRYGNQAWILHEFAETLPESQASEAVKLLRRAVQLAPENPEHRLTLAFRLLFSRDGPEGSNLDDARDVLATIPRSAAAGALEIGIRASILSLTADFQGLRELGSFTALTDRLARGRRPDAFLTFLGQVDTTEDRRQLVKAHRDIGNGLIDQARLNPVKIELRTTPRTKIRIGFMSSDLRSHPVTYFAWPLFEHVDRDRFEIFCYSWFEGATADATQQRITSMVDGFRWHPSIGDREAAQLIADDDLDILFEMGGMTHMSKLKAMAWKPAPLCASWLGYPHSAGLETIDYLLVDPFITPPDSHLLIEKPLMMPRNWIAMSDKAFPENLSINPEAPVRRNGFVTFGTANNPYKYNETMLRSWARVLARVPGSRFAFVRPEAGSRAFKDNILATFAAEGVSGDRIDFRAVRGRHMPHYNDIDIALDTFPQTGGTTTCEALWMGVPTVTVVGEALFERLSYSILHNAGLQDLCASTAEQFIETAVTLAADADRLQHLRTNLRDQIQSGPLGQTEAFAKDFYDLVERTVRGQNGGPTGSDTPEASADPTSPAGPSKLTMANAALADGRTEAAIEMLLSAISDQPSLLGKVAGSLIGNLLRSHRPDEALHWATEALGFAPNDPEIHNFIGIALSMLGRRVEAAEALDRVLAIEPNHRGALTNKGQILAELGNCAEAETIFRTLLANVPDNPQLHRSLGKVLWKQQRFLPAIDSLQHALTIDPRHVTTWLDLSTLTFDMGDPNGALAVLNDAILAIPDDERLPEAKAIMFHRAGLIDQLGPYLESIADRYSEAGWYHGELGQFVSRFDRQAANEHFRKAVALSPGNYELYRSLIVNLLRTRGVDEGAHLDEAHALVRQLPIDLQRKMSSVAAEALLLTADHAQLDMLGSLEELGREWADVHYGALLYQLARVSSADDRREILDQHRLWGEKSRARAERNPISHPPAAGRGSSKIRIGFMSSDLREHVVAYFIWPLLEFADRERFEIYCYSYAHLPEASPAQRHIAGMVDHFRWHPFITDRDAAQLIAEDQIDILFELGGPTQMNKIDVMAWKPATLSVSWLGYPHSSGLDTIDYLLVDPFLNPPDPQSLIEKPLVMPRSWIAMSPQAYPDRHEIMSTTPVARNGFITFGTASNPYKYNAAMLRSWARVVAQVPGSRFLFVRPEGGSRVFTKNIRAHFEAEGVAADRVDFRAVRGDHMGHYNDIDIALDTFPQTGGTTTCDALWMGVPTVTLVGEALFERLSYSILTNAGLGDLCATSIDQFVTIAVNLAADTDRLQALRTGLRDQIRKSPLGDVRQFASDFYELAARTVAAQQPASA